MILGSGFFRNKFYLTKPSQATAIDEKAYVEIEDKFFEKVGMQGENLGTSAYLNKKGDRD